MPWTFIPAAALAIAARMTVLMALARLIGPGPQAIAAGRFESAGHPPRVADVRVDQLTLSGLSARWVHQPGELSHS